MIFYESPHRLLKSLQQFVEYFGADRQASVSRELTKLYEETIRGTLTEIIAYFAEKTIKGEIVIIVAGKTINRRGRPAPRRLRLPKTLVLPLLPVHLPIVVCLTTALSLFLGMLLSEQSPA